MSIVLQQFFKLAAGAPFDDEMQKVLAMHKQESEQILVLTEQLEKKDVENTELTKVTFLNMCYFDENKLWTRVNSDSCWRPLIIDPWNIPKFIRRLVADLHRLSHCGISTTYVVTLATTSPVDTFVFTKDLWQRPGSNHVPPNYHMSQNLTL